MNCGTTIAGSEAASNGRSNIMKKQSLKLLVRFFSALFVGIIFVPGLRAQPAPAQGRFLIIFDTSAAMKKRLPAEVKGIQQLFAINMPEQLHLGDSIGIWTFDDELRKGEFPLQRWQSEGLATISTNIINFVRDHRYAHDTSFAQVTPMINHLVADSSRLTVLIFCDGEKPIAGTPVDDGINAIFKQYEAQMKKVREPFVIVLRSQFGQYTGYTINTSESINIPSFPMPAPPPPVVTPEPPAPQPVPLPPLIIVGNNVRTNPLPAQPPPRLIEKQTPPPAPEPMPPVAEPVQTNLPPVPAPPANPPPQTSAESTPSTPPVVMSAQQTNSILSVPQPVVPMPHGAVTTPATTVTMEASGVSKPVLFAIICGILFVVVAVAYLILRASRNRLAPSLITESLKKR